MVWFCDMICGIIFSLVMICGFMMCGIVFDMISGFILFGVWFRFIMLWGMCDVSVIVL